MKQTDSDDFNRLSLGAPISEHRRMKKSTFAFTVVPVVCFAFAILFLVGFFYSDGSLKELVSALILALFFFACGLPLRIVARRERDLILRTFDDGFSYRRNNRKMAARWDDIANIYEIVEIRSLNGIPMGTFYKYTIEFKNGKKLETSERLGDMEIFSRVMRGRLFPRLFVEAIERYNADDELNFGEMTVSKSGIAHRRKRLSWNELRETQIADGHLKIIGANAKKAWAKIPLAVIPNNFVLTALLEDIFNG